MYFLPASGIISFCADTSKTMEFGITAISFLHPVVLRMSCFVYSLTVVRIVVLSVRNDLKESDSAFVPQWMR